MIERSEYYSEKWEKYLVKIDHVNLIIKIIFIIGICKYFIIKFN